GDALARPRELSHEKPPVPEPRLQAAELDARARELERRRRAQRERHLARALERDDFAAPGAGGIAAAQSRTHLGSGRARAHLRFVARERAGELYASPGDGVAMRQLKVLELRIDHSLRRAPGAAERAACLDAAGELVEELLEVRCVKRPHELVRRRAEAAVHARARRAEARRRIGLKHMTAGDPGAALGGERQLEQGTVRDRPADIDARLGGKPPLRLDRAAERAGGIVAEGGGIEVRELEIRLEGERIGEAQPAGAGELAALRGGAPPSPV